MILDRDESWRKKFVKYSSNHSLLRVLQQEQHDIDVTLGCLALAVGATGEGMRMMGFGLRPPAQFGLLPQDGSIAMHVISGG